MASGQSPVPAGEFMNAAQKSSTFLILILLTVLFITGCRSGEVESAPPTPPGRNRNRDQFVGIPNPASFYCQEMGYELELRESAGGTEGICILPDGKECEEWEFLAGGCAIEWTSASARVPTSRPANRWESVFFRMVPPVRNMIFLLTNVKPPDRDLER